MPLFTMFHSTRTSGCCITLEGRKFEVDRKIFYFYATNLCKLSLSGNIVPNVQKKKNPRV